MAAPKLYYSIPYSVSDRNTRQYARGRLDCSVGALLRQSLSFSFRASRGEIDSTSSFLRPPMERSTTKYTATAISAAMPKAIRFDTYAPVKRSTRLSR